MTNTYVRASIFNLKVRETKSFLRLRTKEVGNFLWDIKQFFSMAKAGLDEQVNISVMYLIGDTKLWWRTTVYFCISKVRASIFNLKVPETKSFLRLRSSKEVGNFLWDIKQFFSMAKAGLDEQVNISVMYLIGDTKLWWRTTVYFCISKVFLKKFKILFIFFLASN